MNPGNLLSLQLPSYFSYLLSLLRLITRYLLSLLTMIEKLFQGSLIAVIYSPDYIFCFPWCLFQHLTRKNCRSVRSLVPGQRTSLLIFGRWN
ncbi:hypothetical protein BZA77DRAFT_316663 [Pyronema omphalodes]|nr:hypothetical protein BZA77DRAFT_316663 [Pyronema omphalodes]